ncbi:MULTISPECIES: hypothetical protein [unclassified Corynebacterium]|uniref:hypothetical protein n=1 Tax=unclassified Corynebacterium TaxID=2624378 RepID=UPI0029C9B5A3|nr:MULTISPECIES: hypothetical protein [unclassified Corynebacterium]WPF66182.1 hypothetical protein OLX12_00130 [Corynebacterium sp. 22KM0430]WPF68674.1 hypothetical protein OLW90_00130 [Corynebacterium sp. 21KM1197]
MNTTVMKMALSTGRDAWSKYRDFRERKASEAYDALADAAETASRNYEDAAESFKENAGKVAQQARRRLNNAVETLESKGKDLYDSAAEAQKKNTKEAKKMSRRTKRRAEKAAAKATAKAQKKLDRKESKKSKKKGPVRRAFGIFFVLSVLAGVGAALWNYFRKPAEVGPMPPRIKEFASSRPTQSELIYSTTTPTPEEEKQKQEEQAQQNNEEGLTAEGEDLIASLDEQLERHRKED